MKAETTKRNIKNAFLELARKVPVNKISITSLVVQANVSRGTFYTHYDNIRNMLEDISQDLLWGLDVIWQAPVTHHSILHIIPSSSEQFVQYLSENRDIFTLLLGKHGDPSFMPHWVEHLRGVLLSRLRSEGLLPTSEIERVIEFTACHVIQNIREAFLSGNFAETAFEMLSIMDSILHFIVAGHQLIIHAETVHERDQKRERPLAPYLY